MTKNSRKWSNARRGQALTEQEVAVMWLVAEGRSNKTIGVKLAISEHTVKFHVMNALVKLGAEGRTRAAVDFVLAHEPIARERFARPA